MSLLYQCNVTEAELLSKYKKEAEYRVEEFINSKKTEVSDNNFSNAEKDYLSEKEKEILSELQDPDEEIEAQYKWDEDYQRYVLGMLLSDQHFLLQALPLVQPVYFTNHIHQLACRILFRHFSKYKLRPSKAFLMQELEDAIIDKDEKAKWRHVAEVASVYDFYNPGIESREYILDKIMNFARIQALKLAVGKSLELIRRNPEADETWTQVGEMLREAQQIERSLDIGLDYFSTYETRLDEKDEKESKVRFTTAFKDLDDALVGGGPSVGEMYAWVGLSGTGKSLAMVTCAVKNVTELGKRVLYVSLEMDEDKIAERFDAQFSKINIGKLEENKDIIKKALQDQVQLLDDPRLLVIKQFPSGQMDVDKLRAYVTQLSLDGFHPDMIIVDYVGEMKDYPNMPTWESRFRIIRNLRGLAIEEQVCLVTAIQPNKSAREVQKEGVIDDDNLADAFGQIRPLDGCWSINQMREEKEAGLARIFVIKHRHGKSRFICYAEYDQETLEIRQISKTTYENRWKVHRNNEKVYQAAADVGSEFKKGDPNAVSFDKYKSDQEAKMRMGPPSDENEEKVQTGPPVIKGNFEDHPDDEEIGD